MKYVITFLHILCYGFLAMAGLSQRAGAQAGPSAGNYRVSATPAPAHILIEEFTGLHCSYCPQAHTIANNLTYVAGDRVHVMAVHTGNLAVPSGDEVDLRTSCGDIFYAWQDAGGMPSGNINRTHYPECMGESYSLYRNEWAAVAKRLLASEEPAAMNLYVEARLDTSERIIYILVEAYSAETADTPLFLNVALTENFVPGTQAGSSLRTYLHRHVLRDMVTGVFGDTLQAEETVKGTYLRRTYTYRLPERYNNRVPNAANLSCLVFVTDGGHTVINSAETEVESPFRAPLDYLQINLYNLEKTYGGRIYDVYVVNPSDDTLRSLTFTFDLDGDTRTCRLDGLRLFPKTESVVNIETDFDASRFQNANVYTLKLTEANGRPVEANQVKNSFSRPVTLPSGSFKILFTSDLYGSENTVSLTDERGGKLYGAGPFEDGKIGSYSSGLIEAEENEVYTLRVTDAFRDGASQVPARDTDDEAFPTPGIVCLTPDDSVFYKGTVGVYGHLVSFALPRTDMSGDTTSNQVALRAAGFTAGLRPNPAQDRTVLQVDGLETYGEVHISVYNLQGRLMQVLKAVPQNAGPAVQASLTLPLSVANYPQGLYLVRVEQHGRQQVVKLLVKK
ncbi:MAG: Omp28-related outer membrane protein [Bacteroidales bacterium]|nr:Omp28-related outer membrane protein [Bacteroidales bacterium]